MSPFRPPWLKRRDLRCENNCVDRYYIHQCIMRENNEVDVLEKEWRLKRDR
ncbi:hypothetical protein RSAG8_05231, partial [Rhizoctonia solani AG-8 WAC10335]